MRKKTASRAAILRMVADLELEINALRGHIRILERMIEDAGAEIKKIASEGEEWKSGS